MSYVSCLSYCVLTGAGCRIFGQCHSRLWGGTHVTVFIDRNSGFVVFRKWSNIGRTSGPLMFGLCTTFLRLRARIRKNYGWDAAPAVRARRGCEGARAQPRPARGARAGVVAQGAAFGRRRGKRGRSRSGSKVQVRDRSCWIILRSKSSQFGRGAAGALAGGWCCREGRRR